MELWIIAPFFNEGPGIEAFINSINGEATTLAKTSKDFVNLVLVDDGSSDDSMTHVENSAQRAKNLEIHLVTLSRNFGHQAAIQAGIEFAFGKSTHHANFVIMDSDLQHPPRLIPIILLHLQNGIDHVQLVRKDNRNISWLQRWSSQLFYKIYNICAGIRIPKGGADYRGFSKRFLEAYISLREKGRFNRGLFHWVGFPVLQITYEPDSRVYGKSKYKWTHRFRLAILALTQFSSRPLLISIGLLVALGFVSCLSYFTWILVLYFSGHKLVVGWTTIIFFIFFWGGALSLGQLLLAVYVSRIFHEVKNRPVFLISNAQLLNSGTASLEYSEDREPSNSRYDGI